MDHYLPIKGYVGYYEISNTGDVFRITTRGGNPTRRQMKQSIRNGYPSVMLSRNGKRKQHTIHRCLWEAFHGRIPQGMQINHINGDKTDNNLENLEVVTPKRNVEHSINILGNLVAGENNAQSILTRAEIIEIRNKRAAGDTISNIAKQYKMSPAAIRDATTGRNWKCCGGPITPPIVAVGEDSPRSKLTDDQVIKIRALYFDGKTIAWIARQFDVTWPTIKRIVTRRGWNHI